MEYFKIRIRLTSSLLTPFHSDILWGHVCWALRYIYGERELEEFLDLYSSDEPPIIISNAFHEGYLPYPVLPTMKKEEAKYLIQRFWKPEDYVMGVNALKTLLKTPHISRDILLNNTEQEISNEFLMGLFLMEPNICPQIASYLPEPCLRKYDSNGNIACSFISSSKQRCPQESTPNIERIRTEKTEVYHSNINRLSGTTQEMSLFTTEEMFFGSEEFEAYCIIGSNFQEKKLSDCLAFISSDGYGRKKSTGKGNIKCTLDVGDSAVPPADANAFMTLSNYVPKSNDPIEGYYKAFTKYGKLGGHFASSPITIEGNPMPFKYPLVMFEAGSVFWEKEECKNYGRIVNKMHPVENPNIVHYGLAYPLFLKIREQYD